MNKKEYIERYGAEAYAKKLEQKRAWAKAHREEAKARSKKWREAHPEEEKAYQRNWYELHSDIAKVNSQESDRKGGRRYDKTLFYNRTGLRGDRNAIRHKHKREYRPYKDIIAPNSQIHHEWLPDSADYRGVALVEADQHMHGVVDVIEILDGKITLLTEEEVRKGRRK